MMNPNLILMKWPLTGPEYSQLRLVTIVWTGGMLERIMKHFDSFPMARLVR